MCLLKSQQYSDIQCLGTEIIVSKYNKIQQPKKKLNLNAVNCL